MKQNKNSDGRSYSDKTGAKRVSISSMTEKVLSDYAQQIESHNIHVDKDLTSFSARVFPGFIHSAVCQLIENAIDSMPSGGELNVTLIEGENCWELEVADSTTRRCLIPPQNGRLERVDSVDDRAASKNRSKLEIARRAAVVHGGKVQTWNCPQGGTANVLVIPRRQEIHKAA